MTDTLDVGFNTLDDEFARDPYPVYTKLRASGRVLFGELMGSRVWTTPPPGDVPGVWILTRYADCMAVLRDERVSSDPGKSQLFKTLVNVMLGGEESAAVQLMRHLLLFMDPPDHTRLRSLVNAAFSRKAVEELRPRIEILVRDLLDGRDEIDLVEDFAYPLPVTVIAEMLGVPLSDRETFGRWSRELVDLFGTEDVSPQSIERGNQAILAMNEYFTELANERRRQPRDDLLTAFVEVEDEGERLTHDEMLATCLILLIAGHETTANLIGLGTLALLRDPGAMARVCDERALIPGTVDELLRYDSPVQFTARTTLAPIEIGETVIPEAARILVLIGSANRDPDQFHEADRVDPTRSPNPHLAFGGGIHFCLGAPLARLEARVAFGELLRRGLDPLTDSPEWRKTLPIRALRSLRVRLRP